LPDQLKSSLPTVEQLEAELMGHLKDQAEIFYLKKCLCLPALYIFREVTMNVDNFDRLYSEHYGEICRFCAKLIKNRQEAADLSDEAFVKAYYHFDPDQKTSFRTFIFKIAKNLCPDHYKSKRYRENERTDIIDADLFVDDSRETNGELLHRELMEILHQCLDKLTEEE
jgi:RNA polymerase sigma factor (sigma-70 family)